MTALAPKPVTLTHVASLPSGSRAPEPLVIVGGIPAGSTAVAAHVANATDAADVITQLNLLIASLVAAGYVSAT